MYLTMLLNIMPTLITYDYLRREVNIYEQNYTNPAIKYIQPQNILLWQPKKIFYDTITQNGFVCRYDGNIIMGPSMSYHKTYLSRLLHESIQSRIAK